MTTRATGMPNVGKKRYREEAHEKSKGDIEEELKMTRTELTMLPHEFVMPRAFSVGELKKDGRGVSISFLPPQ